MKTIKYNYLNVIQQNYGFGWEDVSEYEANSKGVSKEKSGIFVETKYGTKRELTLLTHDVREYRLTGYATRVIFRKVLNQID